MRALSSTNLFVCWAGLALALGALACSDSTDGDTQTTGTGGSGGSGGSGETGGSTGGAGGSTGGSGGSAGAGGTVSPDGGEIVCSGTICPATMFNVPGCCTMQNACGVSFNGMCFATGVPDAGARPDGAGVPDPSCASLMLSQLGVTLPGCCMPDNTCGFSLQVAGGCISLETLRKAGLPGIPLPDGGPMSCVFPPPAP